MTCDCVLPRRDDCARRNWPTECYYRGETRVTAPFDFDRNRELTVTLAVAVARATNDPVYALTSLCHVCADLIKTASDVPGARDSFVRSLDKFVALPGSMFKTGDAE
jgi:hypothetical protein